MVASSSLGFFINAKLFMSLNILLGVPVVIVPNPLDEYNISVVDEYDITLMLLFPPVVAKSAKADFTNVVVSKVKWLLSAGATIPANLRASLQERFPGRELTME